LGQRRQALPRGVPLHHQPGQQGFWLAVSKLVPCAIHTPEILYRITSSSFSNVVSPVAGMMIDERQMSFITITIGLRPICT
jgi:hypothetical protein